MLSKGSLVRAADVSTRVAYARDWLRSRPPAEEVLVVSATADAGSDLVREVTSEVGASFGWHRISLGRLAGELAQPVLVDEGLVPVGALGTEALMARVLREVEDLGRYAEVAMMPGFARAAARTIQEIRLARADTSQLSPAAPDLVRILTTYENLLQEKKLADRALVFELATRTVDQQQATHPLVGLPILLLDVPIANQAEEELIAALLARSPATFATVPAGDGDSRVRLERVGFTLEDAAPDGADYSLSRLRAHLFVDEAPPERPLDDSVVVLSAPGESRECVEIARQLLESARSGVPFDRMAVLLRSVEEYRPHLQGTFARAGIPVHFAQGTVRPDPAGRAFLSLLACAAQRLSAQRFSEYLSLGQVPDTTAEGRPPEARPPGDRWVAPDDELISHVVAEALIPPGTLDRTEENAGVIPEDAPVVAGTLRAPRRWEQLLVDAAVIGGLERWNRRLAGLDEELRLDLEEIEDPDGPEGERLRRKIADLAALRTFAMPLLEELEALPESASWGEWIDHLSELATRALRDPDRVLAVLGELAPMAEVADVTLREVQLVLSGRLLEVAVPPPRNRYGRVFVAPAEFGRGMAFDVVVVPGLAEKLFPREIREDPLLLDPVRAALGLPTNDARVRSERLALRMAVGSAGDRVVLTYPRLDLEKARPRVPSFYGLEALRAAEGRLPGFADLASRAESVVETRVGWPAPARPEGAIDEAEHDLALLEAVLGEEGGSDDRRMGAARYLLTANPHLGRALRFRARRWLRRWTPADGLVQPGAAAAAALEAHRLTARSYSATALEHYAACPYRFFLQAIHRLAPREVPEPIDEMGALERGALVHEVQFELFRRLQGRDLLPVTGDTLQDVRAHLDDVIDEVAGRFHEALAPAIERVWADGVAGVRADLREWVRRMATDASGFVPSNFELAFGLTSRRGRDQESSQEAVALDCGIQLRGAIDLVERHSEGRLRVTDHKTGKVRLSGDGIFGGGSVLQPVLYALAAEKLFPDDEVVEGRLSYCTASGGFEIRSVALDETVRTSAEALADAVTEALEEGFLPALPQARACEYCDYRVVCGPYEERRTARKPQDEGPPARLKQLREMP